MQELKSIEPGLNVTSYRQMSQPCTGGSNKKRVSDALAAERKRCTVGSQLC